MPGDPLKKVSAGDALKISAETWNILMDMAGERRQNRPGRGATPSPLTEDRSIALVYNASGGDIDQWSVLGIDDALITPAENLAEWGRVLAFSVVTPALPDHERKFCIALEPIPDGKIGRAVVSGLCQVKVSVGDRDHAHAKVADGSLLLESGDSGPADIVYMGGSTTGEQWCVVRLGAGDPAMLHWGKVQASPTPPTGHGDTNKTVSIKACACDGTGVTGDAFSVKTPLRARSTLDIEADDVVGYVYDDAGERLIVTDIWTDAAMLFWGKVQASPTPPSGKADSNKTVSVKTCKCDGTGETGDAFNVKTPLRPRKSLDIKAGDVVGYLVDADGEKIIVTDIWLPTNAATFIRGTTNMTVTKGDATFTLGGASVKVMQPEGGVMHDPDDGGDVTIDAELTYVASDSTTVLTNGARVYALWDFDASKWRAFAGHCP